MTGTIRERLDDIRGSRDSAPLWTMLPGEAPHPYSVDVATGIEADNLRELLDDGSAERLWNDAVGCIDPALLKPQSRELLTAPPVLIESTPEYRHNAQFEIGSDAAGVLLSQGLDVLLLSVAVPVGHAFVRRGSNSRAPDPEHLAIWLTRQIGWLTSIARRPYAAPMFPDEEQISVARGLFLAAKRFILLHELAHIVIQSGGDKPRVGRPPDRAAGEHERWIKELEADELALQFIESCDQFSDTQWGGITLFLRAQSWVEAHDSTAIRSSHPPAARRIESLRASPLFARFRDSNEAGYAAWQSWDHQLSRMLTALGDRVIAMAPERSHPGGGTNGEYFVSQLEDHLNWWCSGQSGIFADDWARDGERIINWAPSPVLAEIKRRLDLARARHVSELDEASFLALEREERGLALLVTRLPPDVRLSLGVHA